MTTTSSCHEAATYAIHTLDTYPAREHAYSRDHSILTGDSYLEWGEPVRDHPGHLVILTTTHAAAAEAVAYLNSKGLPADVSHADDYEMGTAPQPVPSAITFYDWLDARTNRLRDAWGAQRTLLDRLSEALVAHPVTAEQRDAELAEFERLMVVATAVVPYEAPQ